MVERIRFNDDLCEGWSISAITEENILPFAEISINALGTEMTDINNLYGYKENLLSLDFLSSDRCSKATVRQMVQIDFVKIQRKYP